MARIFESTRIGSLTLDNRLVRSATWEGMATADGGVTQQLVDLYRTLAAGRVGLIISSYLTVHVQGRQCVDQVGAHEDRHVEGLARLARAVHEQRGKLIGQIVHCGGQSSREAMGGLEPWAPSSVSSPGYPEIPRAMTLAQINEVTRSFAVAAWRLKQAGFDGVQLHGAHGYLLSEFLSPSRNRRTDRYGGSLENRARFCVETFQAVRDAVGADFPVLIKLNVNDFLEGSTTETDAIFLAQRLVEAGLDAIEVSGGTPGSGSLGPARAKIEKSAGEAYFLPQAEAIRQALPTTPLILVGGLRSPDVMQRILNSGVVDMFAMSRPFIREPGLPLRWKQGNPNRAACISCLGCFAAACRGEGIRCVELD